MCVCTVRYTDSVQWHKLFRTHWPKHRCSSDSTKTLLSRLLLFPCTPSIPLFRPHGCGGVRCSHFSAFGSKIRQRHGKKYVHEITIIDIYKQTQTLTVTENSSHPDSERERESDRNWEFKRGNKNSQIHTPHTHTYENR